MITHIPNRNNRSCRNHIQYYLLLLLVLSISFTNLVKADDNDEDEGKTSPADGGVRKRVVRRRGILRRKETSVASLLFPGVAPEEYVADDLVSIVFKYL